MDTLRLAQEDSIDEEVVSLHSARSYEKVLTEEKPHRLLSRRVSSQRGSKEASKVRLEDEHSDDEHDLDRAILSLTLDEEQSLAKDGGSPARITFNETAEVGRNSSLLSHHRVGGLETAKGKSIVIDVDPALSPEGLREDQGEAEKGASWNEIAVVEGNTKEAGEEKKE